MLWLILIFSFFTRLWNISYPPNFYFDEVYNAFTTLEISKGNKDAYEWFHTTPSGTAYGWTHPPLAKLITAPGILIFGPTSFGWRIANVLIGTATIYLIYKISQLLLSKNYSLLAAALAATDGLLLIQSRINMNDIVATFFILLSFWAFIKYQLYPSRLSLLRLGAILGLLISTKWTGLYAIALFGIWLGIKEYPFKLKRILLLIVALLVIPALIYLLSYSQYFILGGTWKNFLELQNQMWWYNTTLKATHTYQSDWWTWPFILRPVWYFVDYAGDKIANIYAMGNPILWWLGIPAIFYTLYSAFETRSWRLWLVICGFLAFWLPWARAPRIMFLYHYLPSVPFLAIALAYSLSQISAQYRKYVIFALCTLSFGVFIYFYPHWTGIHISKNLADSYFWLPSWR